MTTPEHTLVGIHAAIAVGAHQRYGWTMVALAGIASNLPDWDGLPMLFDMARFEHGHRVWGHNFFWIALSSLIVATLQYRCHCIEAFARRWKNYLPKSIAMERPAIVVPLLALFLACAIVQTIHLPRDMVVSGGNGLSDWHIKPFWPISDVGYVYPLIPWGDIGPTLILMCGVLPRSLAFRPRRGRKAREHFGEVGARVAHQNGVRQGQALNGHVLPGMWLPRITMLE